MHAVLYASMISEDAADETSVDTTPDVSKEKSEAKELSDDSLITLVHAVKLPASTAAANIHTNFLFITLS